MTRATRIKLPSTPPTHLNVLRYWRTSAADAGLGRGRLSVREIPSPTTARAGSRLWIRPSELYSGTVSRETVRRAFEGQDERFQQIGVHLRPKLFNRSYVHGALKGGDGPEVVAPLATFAVLRRDGSLRPQRTVIPRDILSPMPRFTFMVGSVEKLDAFLTQNPAPDQDENERHDVVWKGYQEYCEQLLEAVTDGWPGSGDEYEQDERGGLLEVSADPAGPNREVVKLYDDILESGVGSALLENFAVHGERPVAPCLETPYEFADRLGHSTAAYPLADKQREVLAHLAVADVGETVAVNGPPGTGKTTRHRPTIRR